MRKPEPNLFSGLKWLIFFRITFTTILLGSTIIFQIGGSSFFSDPLAHLYALIVFVFLLSFIYAILISRKKLYQLFAHAQIGIDTFVVTMIV